MRTTTSQIHAGSLLQPGTTCWRVELADRATLLIDSDAYFSTLRQALLRARRQILIAGWDFDSRIKLPKREAGDEAPEELAELLGYLVRTRPGIEIHVVRWDYHWLYRDDRETDTQERLAALGVHFHDDGCHPVTGCVHHKIVTIDGTLAFCGGIDLTHQRWDTRVHAANDERRRDPNGRAYMPVHDTQLCVSGPVARALVDYLRETWPAEAPAPGLIQDTGDPWPDDLPADFHHILVGIARTRPPGPAHTAIREIETFYLAAIARTEQSLYVENQYFTSTRIARAIAARCRSHPDFDGLLVGMEKPKTATELHTMGYGRSAFGKVLEEEGVLRCIPMVAARSGDRGINVHSKLAIFDDRWLTVGSANLNRRSMGFDIECNLILEAATPAHRRRIEHLRNTLLAEHLGMTETELEIVLQSHRLAELPNIERRERHLVPVDPQLSEPSFGPILAPIFDPELPWSARSNRSPVRRHGALLLLAFIGLAAAAGFYGQQELSSFSEVEQLINSFLRS